MKNQLYMVRKALRLSCVWTATCDAKRPLACRWVETAAPCASSATSADSEDGGLCLCA
jgi:secreted trypsin-like serine protease